ncbi:MAG: hypothetical protein ACE1ZF_02180 [Gemmatimonadales bacterium]
MSQETLRAERFELVDRHGNPRAVLACDADSGAPTCTFLDGSGQTRVTVGLAWNDMPSIQLNAADGTARVALIVRPDDSGMMLVVDDGGAKTVVTSAGAVRENQ